MIGNKKIIVNILARSGSTGIKDKNIADLDGKPVLWYSVTEALKSKYADDICFSTDSRKYAELAEEAGLHVPFLRDPKYARKGSTAADASRWTTLKYEKFSGKKYDYIVDFMNSNPFKIVDDLDACIEMLHKNKKIDTVVAVNRVWDGHPNRIKQIVNGEIQDWPGTKEKLESLRQDLRPPAYIRSGSVYAMKRHVLIDQINRRGKISVPYILPDERVCNLDEPKDLFTARAMMKQRNLNLKNLSIKSKKLKILVTSKINDLTEILETVNDIGEVKILDNVTREKLKKVINDYDVLLCSTNIKINRDLFNKFKKPKIKYIITPSVGIDHLDLPFLKKNKIKVFSLKNSHNDTKKIFSPAELAFAHILNISRNFVSATLSVRNKKWQPNDHIGFELNEKVIGIIGMGAVGTILAKYCKAFGLKIISYDPNKIINDVDVEQVENLNKLLTKSDIISVNVSGDIKNTNLISENGFKLMKKNAILINTSRGNIVNIEDLINNLKKNRIAAAGIDVIYHEDLFPKKYPKKLLTNLLNLQKQNKLFITPHIGGSTFEARVKRLKFVLKSFKRKLEN
tara:strand:+ start:1301 stop:3010 length:1710 start_codon:yes stop_codon:yes gene_type:complete